MVVLTSFTQPTDGIRHRQNNITVYVNDNNLGKGTLFIAESRLSWVSDSGNGFSIEYPHISLHAVSRDLSAFPQECLFLMLDTAVGDEETNNGNGENAHRDENESDDETTEIRLVPDDRGMLEAMFHAMNACQALHPDPEDSFSDEDFYEDADDEIPMEETDHRMAGLRIEGTDGLNLNRGTLEEQEEDFEVEDEEEGMQDTFRGVWGRVGDMGESNYSSVVGGERVARTMAGVGGDNYTWSVGGERVQDRGVVGAGDNYTFGTGQRMAGVVDVSHTYRTGDVVAEEHFRNRVRRGRPFSLGSNSYREGQGSSPSEPSPQMSRERNFDDAEN